MFQIIKWGDRSLACCNAFLVMINSKYGIELYSHSSASGCAFYSDCGRVRLHKMPLFLRKNNLGVGEVRSIHRDSVRNSQFFQQSV